MELRPLASYPPSPVHEALQRWAGGAAAGTRAVAFSGGADSTALLIEEARRRVALDRAAGSPPDAPPLFALHVHHGLQPAADRFVEHCRELCESLNRQLPTRLCVAHVNVDLPPRASVEAQAREARYAALCGMAREQGAGTVLLAQHADDQAETLLIALSRGAGVAGLAGMAPEFVRDGVRFARPLLDVPAPAIERWLHDNAIPFIDDPSNADERFTRNRLRRRVLPPLEHAFPDFRKTFARSARLARHAQALLDERAREDLDRVGDPPVVRALRALSRQRQANLIRYWLKLRHRAIGSEAQLDALLDVVRDCVTRGHGIHIRVGDGYVGRDGDCLAYRAFL